MKKILIGITVASCIGLTGCSEEPAKMNEVKEPAVVKVPEVAEYETWFDVNGNEFKSLVIKYESHADFIRDAYRYSISGKWKIEDLTQPTIDYFYNYEGQIDDAKQHGYFLVLKQLALSINLELKQTGEISEGLEEEFKKQLEIMYLDLGFGEA